MDKNKVITVIKENIVAVVDDITIDQIDPQKAISEYGATSLDFVDVVSSTMRQLDVDIPRGAIENVENIDQLAEIFCQYAKE